VIDELVHSEGAGDPVDDTLDSSWEELEGAGPQRIKDAVQSYVDEFTDEKQAHEDAGIKRRTPRIRLLAPSSQARGTEIQGSTPASSGSGTQARDPSNTHLWIWPKKSWRFSADVTRSLRNRWRS